MTGTTSTSTVAVVGSELYPNAFKTVYARLKSMRDDFPEIHFHIVSTGVKGVDKAATQCAKRLGMSTTVVEVAGPSPPVKASRYIAFWDFEDDRVGDIIQLALLNEHWVEVWGPGGLEDPAGQDDRVQELMPFSPKNRGETHVF